MAEATSEEVLYEQHDLSASDIVAMLQQPLIRVESSPDLCAVIQSLHARLEHLTHLHNRHVKDVKQLVDELSERLQADATQDEPVQEIPQIVSDTDLLEIVPDTASVEFVPDTALVEFAEQMNAVGGAKSLQDSLALVLSAIDACGGTKQLQAQLSCLGALSTANGGPEAIAAILQALSETLDTMGGSSQLGALLSTLKDVCTASKGPKHLASTLQSTHELVAKAGGSDKTVELMDYFKVAAAGAGGPEGLIVLLTCVSDTCQAAGSSKQLVAALKSILALVQAFGSASKLHEQLQGTSELMNALGGFKKLHDMLHTVAVINKQFGSADEMANLIHGLCNQAPVEAEGSHADPEALTSLHQDLTKLQKRVNANEEELEGFENAMEELRAAGRMEAMENIMQIVCEAMKESNNGQQGAVQQEAPVRQSQIAAGAGGPDTSTQATHAKSHRSLQRPAMDSAGGAPTQAGEVHTNVSSNESVHASFPSTMNKEVERGSAPGLAADTVLYQEETLPSANTHSAVPLTPNMDDQLLADMSPYGHPAVSASLSKSQDAGPMTDAVSVPHELESEASRRGFHSQNVSAMFEVSSAGSLHDGSVENAAGTVQEQPVAQLTVTQPRKDENATLMREKSGRVATKMSVKSPALDERDSTGYTQKQQKQAASDTLHQGAPPSEGKRSDLSSLFKTKATAIVKEKRLGKMARFASQALTDAVSKAEKPVMEVLRQLTVRNKEPSGPSQEEIDTLRESAEQNQEIISDLKVQLSEMSEGMRQLKSMQTASNNALPKLWKVVQALNSPPDGDEARGVKQLHGKCISCDRPLNVVRPEHKLGELPIQDNIKTMSILHGPAWESISRPQSSHAPGRTELETVNKHGIDTSLQLAKGTDEYLIKASRAASCRPLGSPGRKGHEPGSLRPASTRTHARKLQRTREKQLGELYAASQAGTTYKSERIGK